MLRLLKEDYAGIVLPAHILAYSPNATIAALRYIDKPYFIDPMTYIYGEGFLEGYKVFKKEDNRHHLKPSIIKLTNDLSLEEYFPEIGASPLKAEDFTDEFITKIAGGSINLQLNKVNSGLLSSTPKLDGLLKEIGQPPSATSSTYPPPQFITAPYFLIPKEQSETWIDINLKLALETKRLAPEGHKVWPILLTYVDLLDKAILAKFKDFEGLITWVEDLNEGNGSIYKEQVRKLGVYKNFVKNASLQNKKVINLYGSYFSAVLLKLGLTAFSNGPLYGEYKSSGSALGGIPPVRVYMPSLHRFYIYSQASELLALHPDLFDSFPTKSKELFKSPAEIAKVLANVTLAQEHFINCRKQEVERVCGSNMKDLVQELDIALRSVGPFLDKPLKGKEPAQLKAWRDTLKAEVE